MRFVKWAIFFAVSFLCSWILITTFSQEVFRTSVPAKIITYETPPLPLYGYVLGAFAVGLLLGLFMAVYNYITLSNKSRKKSKLVKTLEAQVQELKESQSYLQGQLEQKNEVLDRQRSDLMKKKSESDRRTSESLQSGTTTTDQQPFTQPAQHPSSHGQSELDKRLDDSEEDGTA